MQGYLSFSNPQFQLRWKNKQSAESFSFKRARGERILKSYSHFPLSHFLIPVTSFLQWCDMSQQNTLNDFEHFLSVPLFDKRGFFYNQILKTCFHFNGTLPGTKSISRKCNEKCYLMQAVENILTVGEKIQLFKFYIVFLYSLGAKQTEALQSLRFLGRSYM